MAVVDDKTPRLGLLLPFTDNFLQDDVERLRDTFGLLDVLVVTRDKTTGKIADDMLSSVIAKLDAQGKLLTAQIPSSVVQKGPDGKIDASLMPSIAVVDTFPVPNEASMLGLQCERGDIAIREDLGKTFILTQMPPSVLSNWRELTSTNVTSVNGQTGAITGLAKSGVNNDITGLNALSGPLRLGGEAAGDYDAVTLKQLRAASGGAGGASINGVMNSFIGAVDWFMGTRAKLPAGYLQADGQIVLRSLVPDIVAAMQAGMLNVIEASGSNNSDAMWQMTPTGRGRYSWGDGDATTGTTIRLPDLNGVWVHPTNSELNSIPGLFLRGDGMIGKGTGGNETGGIGVIRRSAAPNITGQLVAAFNSSTSLWDQGSGAFTLEGPTLSQVHNASSDVTAGAPRGSIVSFTASNANPIYGNNGATEVRPASVQGIWIIRASGTFTAQNTVFKVVTGDTAEPASGTVVKGGLVGAYYEIAGFTRAFTNLQPQYKWGDNFTSAMLGVGMNSADGTMTQGYQFEFRSNGEFYSPGTVYANGGIIRSDLKRGAIAGTTGGSVQSRILNNSDNRERSAFGLFTSVGTGASEPRYGNLALTADGKTTKTWQFNMSGDFISPGAITGAGPFTTATVGGLVALATGIYPTYVEIQVSGVSGLANGARAITHQASDARKKTKVETIPVGQAKATMDQVRPVSFSFKENALCENQPELPVSYGLIAQEIEALLPDAVITLSDGMKELNPAIMNGFLFAVVKDLVGEIKGLNTRVQQLEKAAN